MAIKIGLVSLGCDKNRVDAEKLLNNVIKSNNLILTNDAKDADIIIINTCAFITNAVKESINTILEMSEYKKDKCSLLMVTGCLPQRFYNEITEELKEVDYFLKLDEYNKINSIIRNRFKIDFNDDIKDNRRILTTPSHFAYLKVSEGCNNFCTYCTIPSIRGRYKSEKIEDLVDEAKSLIDDYDIKELNIVAQDVTRYGYDLYNKYALLDLLDELSKLDIEWIRLNYCYPELVSKDLINYIDNNQKICKYIDVPLQHTDDKILKSMNRKSTFNSIKDLFDKIRTSKNYISTRSTFIIGFPGETETEFNNLCNFIEEYKIDNAGFFIFSREKGTKAYSMSGQVPYSVKQQRLKKITSLQQDIMISKLDDETGKIHKVLCDGIDYERQMFYGRNQYNAPSIDKVIYFKSNNIIKEGNFYNIRIDKRNKLDLIGEEYEFTK